MGFLVTKLTSKMMDIVIEKKTQKRAAQMWNEMQGQNYMGYYCFGMETYGAGLLSLWCMTVLAVIFLIFGIVLGGSDGILSAIAAVFLELMAIFMLVYTKNNAGVIMYSHDCITIYKGNGELHDYSIGGLRSIRVQGKYMIYEGYGETARVLCMGDGVAAYFDHMNARRPDLMQPLLAYQNVVYMLNQDAVKHNRVRQL